MKSIGLPNKIYVQGNILEAYDTTDFDTIGCDVDFSLMPESSDVELHENQKVLMMKSTVSEILIHVPTTPLIQHNPAYKDDDYVQEVPVTVTDKNNNPVSEADVKAIVGGTETTGKTDSTGGVKIKIPLVNSSEKAKLTVTTDTAQENISKTLNLKKSVNMVLVKGSNDLIHKIRFLNSNDDSLISDKIKVNISFNFENSEDIDIGCGLQGIYKYIKENGSVPSVVTINNTLFSVSHFYNLPKTKSNVIEPIQSFMNKNHRLPDYNSHCKGVDIKITYDYIRQMFNIGNDLIIPVFKAEQYTVTVENGELDITNVVDYMTDGIPKKYYNITVEDCVIANIKEIKED